MPSSKTLAPQAGPLVVSIKSLAPNNSTVQESSHQVTGTNFVVVGEIQANAEADNKEKGRQPMGVAAILAQDPHSKPASTDRSPAPFVHASDDSTEIEFRIRYRAFVDAFRAGATRLRQRARELSDMFPLCAFPPSLPFNAPA